jgi:hypothetical protein
MNEFVSIIQYNEFIIAITKDGKLYSIIQNYTTNTLEYKLIGKLPEE